MDIASPFVVVSVIVAIFAACIYLGAKTEEDGHAEEEHSAH